MDSMNTATTWWLHSAEKWGSLLCGAHTVWKQPLVSLGNLMSHHPTPAPAAASASKGPSGQLDWIFVQIRQACWQWAEPARTCIPGSSAISHAAAAAHGWIVLQFPQEEGQQHYRMKSKGKILPLMICRSVIYGLFFIQRSLTLWP